MAVVWNSSGCRNVSNNLTASANKLSELIESELESSIRAGQDAYQSKSADEIFRTLKELQKKGPDFVDAVNRCSKYLTNKVAPAYAEAERKAAERANANV